MMRMLLRWMRSEFIKWKRTPIPWFHVFAPVLGACLFLWYFSLTGGNAKNPAEKLSGYFEVLSSAFPTLIGLICGIAAAQEEQAGGFQVMLCGLRSRAAACAGTLLLLVLLSAGSVALAVGLFAAGFRFAPAGVYVRAALALWGGNVFLYVLHLFVGLRFGRSASIGLGVAGSLISALMLTGLGDGIWLFVPWAWSVRLCDYLVLPMRYASASAFAAALRSGALVAAFASCAAFAVFLVWFGRWEGARPDE